MSDKRAQQDGCELVQQILDDTFLNSETRRLFIAHIQQTQGALPEQLKISNEEAQRLCEELDRIAVENSIESLKLPR